MASNRAVGGKRPRLTDFVKWIAIVTVSLISGFLTCYWTMIAPVRSGPQIVTDDRLAAQPLHRQPIPINLASPEFRRLQRAALYGSKTAALKLMISYEECVASGDNNGKPDKLFIAECDRSFDHWVAIAAANGVGEAANLTFNKLSASDRCEDIYRARFWSTRMPWWGREPWISADAKLSEKEKRCGW